MNTVRLYIVLDNQEMAALQAMARADYRPLREQARFIIREVARQKNLLPANLAEASELTSTEREGAYARTTD